MKTRIWSTLLFLSFFCLNGFSQTSPMFSKGDRFEAKKDFKMEVIDSNANSLPKAQIKRGGILTILANNDGDGIYKIESNFDTKLHPGIYYDRTGVKFKTFEKCVKKGKLIQL